jgi:hypothetical protein
MKNMYNNCEENVKYRDLAQIASLFRIDCLPILQHEEWRV